MINDRHLKIITVVLAIVALVVVGVGFLDPFRGTTEPATVEVSPDQPTSTIFEKSQKATFTGSHTVEYTEYKTPEKKVVLERRTTKVDSLGKILASEYERPNQSAKNWEYEAEYRGEHIFTDVRGDTNTLGTPSEDPRAVLEAVAWRPPHPPGVSETGWFYNIRNSSALKVIQTTDSKIILGVESKDRYLKLLEIRNEVGTDEFENVTQKSSIRIHIDRDTGRITKLTHHYHRTNKKTYRVYKISDHGSTTVERPDWANRLPREYLYDFLHWWS